MHSAGDPSPSSLPTQQAQSLDDGGQACGRGVGVHRAGRGSRLPSVLLRPREAALPTPTLLLTAGAPCPGGTRSLSWRNSAQERCKENPSKALAGFSRQAWLAVLPGQQSGDRVSLQSLVPGTTVLSTVSALQGTPGLTRGESRGAGRLLRCFLRRSVRH